MIVCEGEKTEPSYFEALAADLRITAQVIVKGLGDNTDNLVEEAIRLKQVAEGTIDPYEQVWCVFDRDSFPVGRFNRAIHMAKDNGLHIAYSNEAFEPWYVLHFEYLQSGIPRDDYIAKLSRHCGKKYKKNSLVIYKDLRVRQQIAIDNAARLLAIYDPPDPACDNPSTTVHLLVQELKRFRRD